ncbi:alpha/beta hydrolase [Streptomyces sp. A1277]|nr:alpha/beta hydrolase [Streptomyces sp. A1277]
MSALVHRTISIRPGLELAVRESGQGRVVLVLHGAPGPVSTVPLVEHLAAGHRVLAPTHPGWEDTVRPATLDSVAALAAVYHDLLDQQCLDDVTVVGTSFGGWVAARMAVDDRARRISRLVLMDALGPEIPGQPVTMPSGPPLGAPAGPGAPTTRGGPPAQMLATLRAYTGPDLHDAALLPSLSTVACPVLAVWGTNDTAVTPDFGRAYAAAFPHGRFELVHGAGHLPIREKPEAVFRLLDTFLATPGVHS